jgi:hypothetical protein
MHLILRTRPDVVETWSDREVAHRWLRLFPGRRLDEFLGEPTENDIDALAGNSDRIVIIRTRLSDISWFMRCVSEPIARMANREDECTGRFWEGRFKAQPIMDEAGLLACSMYVDLNPVRAALAASPMESQHTSAYDRIRGARGEEIVSVAGELTSISVSEAAEEIRNTPLDERKRNIARRKNKPGPRIIRDAWLAPLTLSERGRPSAKPSRSGVRASDKGFLAMAFEDYLQLLDWTGRQGRKDKRGKIPASVAPILQRLGINGSMWCDLVWNFRRYFGNCAGSPASMREDAESHGRRWHRGQRAAQECFASS